MHRVKIDNNERKSKSGTWLLLIFVRVIVLKKVGVDKTWVQTHRWASLWHALWASLWATLFSSWRLFSFYTFQIFSLLNVWKDVISSSSSSCTIVLLLLLLLWLWLLLSFYHVFIIIEGLQCCCLQGKGRTFNHCSVPSFLNYFKTLSIGLASGLKSTKLTELVLPWILWNYTKVYLVIYFKSTATRIEN